VRVRRNEEVAIHIGPEPCADVREDVGEASAGERIGQPLSRESDFAQGADAVTYAEGNTDGHGIASVQPTLRGLRPWHVRKLLVAGFEHESDAVRFLAELRERLEKFALSLHPDKTRLIEFGRHAADNRQKRGLGKPETFNFLGFTHICGRSRGGLFSLHRKTRRDRMGAKLRALKGELKRRMHEPIPQQGRWLGQVVRGYFQYHAVPTNYPRLAAFHHHVTVLWLRTLRRRSQKDWSKWDRMARLAAAYLPLPRILHPWPNLRFAVKHPRWEPGA
jgi:RNA-directed DNA polymerase